MFPSIVTLVGKPSLTLLRRFFFIFYNLYELVMMYFASFNRVSININRLPPDDAIKSSMQRSTAIQRFPQHHVVRFAKVVGIDGRRNPQSSS